MIPEDQELDLYLNGGAAILIAYDGTVATKDVDAIGRTSSGCVSVRNWISRYYASGIAQRGTCSTTMRKKRAIFTSITWKQIFSDFFQANSDSAALVHSLVIHHERDVFVDRTGFGCR